jgi:hypothetical protein
MWPIDKPIPYQRNSRRIPERAIDNVAASINQFGFRSKTARALVAKLNGLFPLARQVNLAKTAVCSSYPESPEQSRPAAGARIGNSYRGARLHGAVNHAESKAVTIFAMKPRFTERQGQYLAFIHYYTKVNGKPPAEADMQRYFRVTPPTVHQMVVTLEANGFIERVPGQGRSIRLLIPREELPELE